MLPGHTYANCSCRLEKRNWSGTLAQKREKELSCRKKDFLDFSKITKSSSSSNDEAMEAALIIIFINIFPGMAHRHIIDRWRLLSSENSIKVNAKSCATQCLSFFIHSQLEAKHWACSKIGKKVSPEDDGGDGDHHHPHPQQPKNDYIPKRNSSRILLLSWS